MFWSWWENRAAVKTTTIKMIMRALTPDSAGELIYNGGGTEADGEIDSP